MRRQRGGAGDDAPRRVIRDGGGRRGRRRTRRWTADGEAGCGRRGCRLSRRAARGGGLRAVGTDVVAACGERRCRVRRCLSQGRPAASAGAGATSSWRGGKLGWATGSEVAGDGRSGGRRTGGAAWVDQWMGIENRSQEVTADSAVQRNRWVLVANNKPWRWRVTPVTSRCD